MLKSKVSNEQKVVTALQALNTKLASIATKATDLAKATAWGATKATSDNDQVTVTADRGASVASVTMSVTKLAASARATYATTGTTSTQVMDPDLSYRITYDDPARASETFTTGTGTLQEIADALNAKDGVTATLFKVGEDTSDPANPKPVYQLQVASTETGADSGFTITQFDPADPATPLPSPIAFMGGATSVAGVDAEFTVNGQALTSSTNTITDLMPGVDVTLLAGSEGKSATITVARDMEKLTESVKAMVESVNAALSEIGTLTAYDAATKKAGLLGGDSTLRSVRNQLLESVSRGLGGDSLATVGIEVDRYGKLTFDEAEFKAAYAADPAGTVAKFAGTDASPTVAKDAYDPAYGIADRLKVLGEAFSDSIDGTITNAIKSRQSAIRGMEDDIADWDVRLATRQTTLQRQYTALETVLGKLQSQSSWLAGQLASLPQMSTGQ
jgi:flagellar hook-associated protein 2